MESKTDFATSFPYFDVFDRVRFDVIQDEEIFEFPIVQVTHAIPLITIRGTWTFARELRIDLASISISTSISKRKEQLDVTRLFPNFRLSTDKRKK